MRRFDTMTLDGLDAEGNLARWRDTTARFACTARTFEIHCWEDEGEALALALRCGEVRPCSWPGGVVVSGEVTPGFVRFLLALPRPAGDDPCRKMTPFFSIFFDNGYSSEHYGTELHIPIPQGGTLMLSQTEMLQLLRREVTPALGCTEPVCVALAAADAAKAAGGEVRAVSVRCSAGIFKNGMAVGIPGFDRVGLPYAAALGALIAQPQRGLEVFSGLTPAIARQAVQLVEEGAVSIAVDQGESGVFACAEVQGAQGTGVSVIRGGHANIVLTKRDGQVLFEKPYAPGGGSPLHDALRTMTVAEIAGLVRRTPADELAFLLDGPEKNGALADYALETGCGIGAAKAAATLEPSGLAGGLLARMVSRVTASVEARMAGCPLSAMSSAGSGNQGLITALALEEGARFLHASQEDLSRALAAAHLLNVQIKQYIGKLSATCVCAVSSAASVAAGLCLLMGGDAGAMGRAVINISGSLTGMICDGGKAGCAFKLAAACSMAVISAAMAMQGVVIPADNGVCAATPEEAIRNMGKISDPGMKDTDQAILDIMLNR